MCGICGVVYADGDRRVEVDVLRRMTSRLAHRGPDGEGFHVDTGVGLGVRRLAIVDVSGGDQPLASEDGAVTVVGNGEIYNAPELREELSSAGHRFRTRSDTEVIVHLYEERGVGCLERLRGMFAFALWDARRRRLFLARDRFGIKPLTYAIAPDRIVFGSEMKAILASGASGGPVDLEALRDVLTIGFVLAPRTLFTDVRALAPGHYLLYEDGVAAVHGYWRPSFPSADELGDGGEVLWAERLRAKLEEAVRLHLRSDVPVGAWLSGGLDSSSVVALMRRLGAAPVRTFSLAFDDPRLDEVGSSALLTDLAADGLVPERARCAAADLALLPAAIWHGEDPLSAGLAIAQMLLARLASSRVKAVMAGEGADEVFGGYWWFKVDKALRPFTRLPAPLRRLVADAPVVRRRFPGSARRLAAPARMGLACYRQIMGQADDRFPAAVLSDDLRARLAKSERGPDVPLPDDFPRWHPFTQLQYLELTVRLPNFVTRYLDASSMAYALEVRVPFLDHELVELAARIPPALKMRRLREKHILREAMRGILPEEIRTRPKRPLMAPLDAWARALPAFARDALSARALRDAGYFDPRAVDRLLEAHRAGRARHGLGLMTVLGVQLWHRTFVDGRASGALAAS